MCQKYSAKLYNKGNTVVLKAIFKIADITGNYNAETTMRKFTLEAGSSMTVQYFFF